MNESPFPECAESIFYSGKKKHQEAFGKSLSKPSVLTTFGVVNFEDTVKVIQHGWVVEHYKYGTLDHESTQVFRYGVLGFSVERAGGFIQQTESGEFLRNARVSQIVAYRIQVLRYRSRRTPVPPMFSAIVPDHKTTPN